MPQTLGVVVSKMEITTQHEAIEQTKAPARRPMQTTESQAVIARFFQALYALKARKRIRGKQTFTTRYGINRWNFLTLEKEQHRDIFQTAWLSFLVRDYGVSAHWLLTGEGEMFTQT